MDLPLFSGKLHPEQCRVAIEAGVVGITPDLQPGALFQYHSATNLPTPTGHMHGSFQMKLIDEQERASTTGFDALIQPFPLTGRKGTPFGLG